MVYKRGALTDSSLSEEVPKVPVWEVRCDDHDWFALSTHSKERKDVRVAEVGKNLCLCQEVVLILFITFVCEEGGREGGREEGSQSTVVHTSVTVTVPSVSPPLSSFTATVVSASPGMRFCASPLYTLKDGWMLLYVCT